jgi:hypothetical protein
MIQAPKAMPFSAIQYFRCLTMQSLYTRLVKNTRPKYGSKTDKIPTFWIPEFIIPAHPTNLMKPETRSGLMERITTMHSMAGTGAS